MTEQRSRALGHLRRGLGLTALVVVLAIVAVFAAIAVPPLVGAEHSYVVLSGSMSPTMQPGDVILVDEVDVEAVEAGQIVTFRRGEGVTTHRVVDVVRDGPTRLRTQGDTNPEPDPGLVTNEQLVGRIMTIGGTPVVIPYAGQVVETARTDLGIYALVFIPLTLLVLNEIYTRIGSAQSRGQSGGSNPSSLEPLVTTHAVAEGVSVTGAPGALATSQTPSSSVDRPPSGAAVGLDPRVFRITPIVLLVLSVYGGWMTLEHGSPLTATLAAGSAVTLVLLGAARLQLRRQASELPTPPLGLIAEDVTVAFVALVLAVPLAGWFTVQQNSIPSGMIAAGGAVGLVLLGIVRIQLWLATRRAPTEDHGREVSSQ